MASRAVTDNELPGPSLGLGSNLEIFRPSPSRRHPARTVPVLSLSFSTRLLVPVVGFGIRWQFIHGYNCQFRSRVRFVCLGRLRGPSERAVWVVSCSRSALI